MLQEAGFCKNIRIRFVNDHMVSHLCAFCCTILILKRYIEFYKDTRCAETLDSSLGLYINNRGVKSAPICDSILLYGANCLFAPPQYIFLDFSK